MPRHPQARPHAADPRWESATAGRNGALEHREFRRDVADVVSFLASDSARTVTGLADRPFTE